jgi:hypothetical protein
MIFDQIVLVNMDNALLVVYVAKLTMRGWFDRLSSDYSIGPGAAHHSEGTLLLTFCLAVLRTLLIDDNSILYKVN